MVQLVSREATEDIEVAGHEFQAGDHVIVLLGAANRDPARFPDPDRLDLGRDDGPHLTFSQGMHHCLGAALARLEGQVVLGTLVQRFPDMRLLTPDVRYREHLVLRGITGLRVAV
jgi:cytochrome P450